MPLNERLNNCPRTKHAYLLGVGWWAMLVAAWSILSSADLFVSRVCDRATQDKWAAIWLHPTWGWKTWLLGVCVITTGVIFEGSFRKSRRQELEHGAAMRALSKAHSDAISEKDQAFKDARLEWIDKYRAMEGTKEKEREAIQRTLDLYQMIWARLQSRSRELAIDLREYCEVTGPLPTPPLIAGESDADFVVRQSKLGLLWMDKVNHEYNERFADRVVGLRDEFATCGYEDFKLDSIIRNGVVHTDAVMEIADRLMGLALHDLAKRYLRTMTLKQLCGD